MLPTRCIVFFVLWLNYSVRSDCDFNFKTDFPDLPPLFLQTEAPELVLPVVLGETERGVSLEDGESILLACAGNKNSFSDTSISEPTLTVKCGGNNILSSGTRKYTLKDLECKNKVRADILKIDQTCARGKAKAYEIGFNVTSELWLPLIDVCYDPEKSITYYTNHSISGFALIGAEVDNSRPSFAIGLKELYPDFDPDDYYQQPQQLKTLQELLGSDELAQEIVDASYLNRGHLAPDGDFPYTIVAHASYFYINAVPQWQNRNGGLWNSLEMSVRNLAKDMAADLKVFTGTYDILTWPDVNENEVKLFLYNRSKLPIPKFTWKIIYDPASKNGIAFVGLNNPLDDSVTDWPCTNICDEHGWGSNSWKNKQICCTVDDFGKIVVDSPSVVVNGVLEGLNEESFS